jgi:XTP/dITP diphosphohydrolase
MKKLIFVTGNKNKAREVEKILGVPLEVRDIDLDEIQSLDLGEVVQRKVEMAFKAVKKPVFVDDVGLKIDALNGFPGPLVKFFLTSLSNEDLLKLLQGEKNRRVTVQSAIGYHDGKRSYTFIGEFKGTLSKEPRGDDGWGFNFIVIPDGYSKTLAELGFEETNNISHRKRSLEKFKKFLNSKNKI